MRDLDPAVRSALKYTGEDGSAVLGVSPGSPAEAAGLQPWDVVLAFNGQTIRNASQLFTLVQNTHVGDAVTLKVWRKGALLELRAIITESGASAVTRPPEVAIDPGRAGDPEEILHKLGIEVRDLSVPERMRGLRGVVVTSISSTGPASGKLHPGDLIIAVQNSPINSAGEFFLHLAASAAVQETAIHLLRDGQSMRVTIPALPDRE
jgi:serine protease Do